MYVHLYQICFFLIGIILSLVCIIFIRDAIKDYRMGVMDNGTVWMAGAFFSGVLAALSFLTVFFGR